MLKENKWKHAAAAFQILAIFYLLCTMLSSDSYYAAYLLIGMAGMFACGINWREQASFSDKRERMLTWFFALGFALAIAAANYEMFMRITDSRRGRFLSAAGVFLGSFCVFWNILLYAAGKLRNFSFQRANAGGKVPCAAVFLFSALPMAALNLLVLFLCAYPGNLTNDSVDQVAQLVSGQYSNHHPFYHTMLIGLFLKAGYALFGSVNAAVAVYSVLQILFIAGCFAFAMVTLYQAGIPGSRIAFCVLFYTVMPFHIMYSFTMWKDIWFAGFVLLFTVSAYRVLADIGRHRLLDRGVCLAGGLGMCLFRSNGFVALLIALAGFFILFRGKYRRLSIGFLLMIVVAFLGKHPLLAALHVSQPDTIESLSIPAQQVARVVVACNDLTEEQRELLGGVLEVDRIPEAYVSFFFDPLKNLIRGEGNQAFLTEHKGKFLKLYVELGISHPVQYIEAWIDETRGFWNGGYSNWKWFKGVLDNDLGIQESVNSEGALELLEQYLELYETSNTLVIFLCIGVYVWIVAILLYLGLIRRDRVSVFLTLPTLAVVLTLLVATPVFSEFRYAYTVFCTIPFLLLAPFAERPEKDR
ncbi:MAG: DUF6020 family protein [Blautia sp.]|nr:DUF6020 family protein [Blautia sp.]